MVDYNRAFSDQMKRKPFRPAGPEKGSEVKPGGYESVDRFLRRCGTPKTREIYAFTLGTYLAFLRSKGVELTPDELVKDNLVCVFNSDATDVRTKRRHTDYLDEFVNVHLAEGGYLEAAWPRSSLFMVLSA
jgi:hypothetical protein